MKFQKIELLAIAVTAVLCCVAVTWNVLLRIREPRFSVSPAEQKAVSSTPQSGERALLPEEPAELVDLNTDSAEELTRLVGIGPVLAERIVAWREAHGPFHNVRELEQVRGISRELVEKNLERIAAITEDVT